VTPWKEGVDAEVFNTTIVPSMLQPFAVRCDIFRRARRDKREVDAKQIVERVRERCNESNLRSVHYSLSLTALGAVRRVE